MALRNNEGTYANCMFTEIKKTYWCEYEKDLVEIWLPKAIAIGKEKWEEECLLDVEHCGVAFFFNKKNFAKEERPLYVALWDRQRVDYDNAKYEGDVWLCGYQNTVIPMLDSQYRPDPENNVTIEKGMLWKFGESKYSRSLSTYHRVLKLHSINVPWLHRHQDYIAYWVDKEEESGENAESETERRMSELQVHSH